MAKMAYYEPPPSPGPEKEKSKAKFRKLQLKQQNQHRIKVQKAQVGDVEEILALINGFAASDLMLPRGPQYLYENIRDFIIASDQNVPVYSLLENRKTLHMIVACGSLHVLWGDVAEIRSLAIHPDYQHVGLGSQLVEHMQADAKLLGIRQLFTFTLQENFFKTLGFKKMKKQHLPPKVWGECSRCPKYFKCDEVGMVLDV